MNLARPSGSFLNLGVMKYATTQLNTTAQANMIMNVVLSIVTSV